MKFAAVDLKFMIGRQINVHFYLKLACDGRNTYVKHMIMLILFYLFCLSCFHPNPVKDD